MSRVSRDCAIAGCGFSVWFDTDSVIPTLAPENGLPSSFTSSLTCEGPAQHTVRYRITIAAGEPVIGDPVATPADEFWLGYGAEMIRSAIDRRDQAADKLQAYVAWLWSIFTAATTLGFSFAKLGTTLPVIALVVATQVALIIAYGLCTRVRLPVDTAIVANSPETIVAAYRCTVAEKRKRLRKAFVATSVSVALVGVALAVASVCAPSSKADPPRASGAGEDCWSVALAGVIMRRQIYTLADA